MANVGYATLQVVPSLKGFSSKLRLGMGGALTTEGAKAGESTGRSFASSFAKFAAAGAVAAGVVSLGKSFVDAAIESQKVTKQTEAVLKSMGNVAGVTAADVSKLSEALSLKSGVDDEVIQNAQNVLLTFGKVRNEVGKGNKIFDRATTAALDMSVALKQDLQGATIQIGKALNDPIKGLTALARAGVSFTEEQKAQVKQLVKTGKTMDAQKLILRELEKQFGGSAAAQATAGDRLKVVWGNLQEQLGAKLLPVVERVAGWLADNLPGAMDTASEWVNTHLIPALKDLWHWFEEEILPTLQTVSGWMIDHLVPAIGEIGTTIGENETALKVFAGLLAAIGIAGLIATHPLIVGVAAVVGFTAITAWAVDKIRPFREILQFTAAAAWNLYEALKSLDSLGDVWRNALSFGEGLTELPGNFFGGGGGEDPTKPSARGAARRLPVPSFGLGGVVPGTFGRPRLIVAHAGETILPTHKAGWSPMAAGGNGLALDLAVGIEPGANDSGILNAFMRAIRVRPATRRQLGAAA